MSSTVPTAVSAAGSSAGKTAEQGSFRSAVAAEPLVSVIVPCYNGELFLEETLQSALAQTHPAVEVIVVDDGSADNSAGIARRFPVRYIRQENRGLSEARNTGIRVSRGEYLVFLDADDRLLPDAIKSGLHALGSHPDCVMTIGNHCFIGPDGSRLRSSVKAPADHCHYEALLKSNFIEMISSVLFRRDIFAQVGTFDASLRVSEDYDLYLRIAREHTLCCHNDVVAEYRLHPSNVSRNSELMLTTTIEVLDRQAKYVAADTGRRLAFQRGHRSWRKQYGRQLMRELASSFSTLSVTDRRRKLNILARRYPQGLFMLAPFYIAHNISRITNAILSPAPSSNLFEAD